MIDTIIICKPSEPEAVEREIRCPECGGENIREHWRLVSFTRYGRCRARGFTGEIDKFIDYDTANF